MCPVSTLAGRFFPSKTCSRLERSRRGFFPPKKTYSCLGRGQGAARQAGGRLPGLGAAQGPPGANILEIMAWPDREMGFSYYLVAQSDGRVVKC